ncbi:MAG: hypothetical protein KG029_07535 [Bacteroidetes bacterium]|nr:hypothetical protein [Bacteroidota bacterium]
MKKLAKFWILLVMMFFTCTLQAQIDGYIQGDVNYSLVLAFHKADTVIVVLPDNYILTDQEKTAIENYVFWEQYQKKPVYIYRSESELCVQDKSRNLQFYGPFCDFQMDEVQNIPIKQVENGFMFDNEIFPEPTDAFFYINDAANRLFTCRNSTQVWHQYSNVAAGYFQLYIFRDTELFLSGFCSDSSFRPEVNHIMKMRQTHFETVATRHFDFKLAKSICTDSLRQVILEQADKGLEILSNSLKTDTLDLERMTTYVYKNMTELQQFLSMSPQMTIFGKSIGSVNHVSSLDMAVFYHELAHTIIGRKIGVQSNSFFCEGFAVYTGYLMENDSYDTDFETTENNLDLLTEAIITGPDYQFYSHPPLYPISGVFTRFIIEKIGIGTFKTIYANQNIEKAFTENGYPLTDLIDEFKAVVAKK